MNESIKKLLRKIGLYHPAQSLYRNILSRYKNYILRQQYSGLAGPGITCNNCGASYQKFAPDYPLKEDRSALEKNNVVAGYGDNVFCPNCMSTARDRMVLAYLKDNLEIDGKNILHLSPEKYIYEFLKKKANVTTADLVPGFYYSIDRHVQKQDAMALTYANECFDLVIANHILEHIPDDRGAISELYRVLKTGGQAIMQVPYSTSLTSTIEEPGINEPRRQSAQFGQKDHVRIYSLKDYISRLNSSGFKVHKRNMTIEPPYVSAGFQQGELFLEITKTSV